MSGSGSKGKWEASSVTEKDVKELREAGYLSAEIAHRLPAKEQVITTRGPAKGLYSSLTFTPLSAASFSTTG